MNRTILAAAVLLLATAALAAPRSHTTRAEFQRANPCPSTGNRRGACPGYVLDHIVPLCAGGADAAANMQWQTAAEAKAKDREEARLCRSLKRVVPAAA